MAAVQTGNYSGGQLRGVDEHLLSCRWSRIKSHIMMSPIIELLRKIDERVVIYEPFRRDTQGIQEFQDIVHRLQEMERQGLIGRLFIQKRMSHSTEYVALVMVQNGLTVEGKRLLAEQERQSQSN